MQKTEEIIKLDHSVLPSGCFGHLVRITIKKAGCIWRIHKADYDQFPSDPHAHDIVSGLVLDLSNGYLYSGRIYIGKTIRREDLLEIRNRITKFKLPPLSRGVNKLILERMKNAKFKYFY